jgi:hypothetical protein
MSASESKSEGVKVKVRVKVKEGTCKQHIRRVSFARGRMGIPPAEL